MKYQTRTNFSELAQREMAYSVPHFTNLATHAERGPLVFRSGEGVYLEDEHGHKYLEGMSGLWCAGLGYSQPRLVAAAKEQLDKLPYSHLFNHRATDVSIELAEALAEISPVSGMRSFFVNSGSEAVDAAIKMVWFIQQARQQPKRHKILVRRRAYHGASVAGAALTGLEYAHTGFELPMQHVVRLSTPHYFSESFSGESEEQFCQRLIDELEEVIACEGAETIAAFFAEPAMGAGGVLLPPKGYFQGVQEVLKRHGILSVADEVICGLGRTGNWWGCQSFAFEPDLLCSAKQLSASYLPIGAVLITPEVYAEMQRFSGAVGLFGTGHTWGGHPACAAVALEALNIYKELDIVSLVQQKSVLMQKGLQEIAQFRNVGHVRSIGLLGGVELMRDKATGERFEPGLKVSAQVVDLALDEGLILRALPGDCIGICPPMIISDEELESLFEKLGRALLRFDT